MDHSEVVIVRTITVFIPSSKCKPEDAFRKAVKEASDLAQALKQAILASNITVQTVRLSTPGPFAFGRIDQVLSAAKILDDCDADYCSLGVVDPTDKEFANADFYVRVVKQTERVALAACLTSLVGVNCTAVAEAAKAVPVIAQLDENGFANMRFAAFANVRSNGPFFPSSFSDRSSERTNSEFRVALGIQGATVLNKIVKTVNANIQQVCNALTHEIEAISANLIAICAPITPITIDFSTAPAPGAAHSVGNSLALLAGVQSFPGVGGLAVTARIADAIDKARFPKSGFCGIMLPICEDDGLANCSPCLSELLTCSSVCGTGLDMVPVAGDIDARSIEAIFMDVALLSMRLGRKPLTIRLMPIPDKQAGEMTTFESQYLCNAPVLSIKKCPMQRQQSDTGIIHHSCLRYHSIRDGLQRTCVDSSAAPQAIHEKICCIRVLISKTQRRILCKVVGMDRILFTVAAKVYSTEPCR